ncbi:transporter substrate-binding domain-containing diguanylate cyclase [Salinivibrio costicola]|uniref:transporter substrate-binding domain-containing diguanylate cyclase n=1 Tax=Salinivibrio costicola TaxID=51367 RepID=UPI000395A022|nr:sensor domain-containing diguanylate cyclase [Salinivibrio costicola]
MFARILRFLTGMLLIACTYASTFAWADDAYLSEEKDILVVAHSSEWKPYSYIPGNGQPKGLLIDFWQAYAKYNHESIQFMLLDWADSLSYMKEGGNRVHAGLLKSPEREAYLDYVAPIFNTNGSLYVQNQAGQVSKDPLAADKVVGVVAGSYESWFLAEHYPNVKQRRFRCNETLFSAALDGEISALVADSQTANFYFLTQGKPLAFVADQVLYTRPIYAAVPKGNQALLNEIRAGIDNIPAQELLRIKQKWINTERVEAYPTWLIPSVALAVLLGAVTYIFILKRMVYKRTVALRQANSRLREFANTDPLTQLLNRRGLDAYFSRQKPKLSRQQEMGLILIDLDHFKQVNDTYGHMQGDKVLVHLASYLKRLVKKGAAARLGGEEFCVLCPTPNLDALIEIANHIRCDVADSVFEFDGAEIRVTVSIGAIIASDVTDDMDALELDALIHAADVLMYRAKHRGRNQVMLASSQSVKTPISAM